MPSTRTRARAAKQAAGENPPAAQPPEPELLSRREAAERSGVHYNTIRLWESQRLITPHKVKLGRREEVRIDAAELAAAAERQAERRPATQRGGALAIPAETLWGMVQDSGQQLAAALERAAKAEVETSLLRGQVKELTAQLERRGGEVAELAAAVAQLRASRARWWQRTSS